MDQEASKIARINFKESLHSIISHFIDLGGPGNAKRPGRSSWFGLHCESNGGVHIILYISSIRLDNANHTIILDGGALPLVVTQMSKLEKHLSEITNPQFKLVQVKVDERELKLWKSILPALVERCRKWEHRKSCEYKSSSHIPITYDFGESPICSCGKGIGLPRPSKVPSGWATFSKHFTRLAISPCFSAPIVDKPYGIPDASSSVSSPSPSTAAHLQASTACSSRGKENREDGQSLLKCARCGKVWYCSKTCQHQHWKKHKSSCKASS